MHTQTQTRRAIAIRRAAPPAEHAADAADGADAAGDVRVGAPTDEARKGDHADTPTAAEGEEQSEEQSVAAVARVGFAPIVRVDADRREIELCATSVSLDSYGTVFDYAASKDAFTRWIGNVREMHERRAVGSRMSVRCDDEQRKVYVRVRISRGAADTWEKVLDGTLRGASIGASNVIWDRQTRRVAGRERLLNVATRYDLVELSLVDNPSNPDALGISIVRDAVPDAAVLDDLSGGGCPLDTPTQAREGVPAQRSPQPAAAHGSTLAGSRDGTTGNVGASGGRPLSDLDERPCDNGGHMRMGDSAAETITGPAARAGDPSMASMASIASMAPEVRIAQQAAAHGWAAVRVFRESKPQAEDEDRGSKPSHYGLPPMGGVVPPPLTVSPGDALRREPCPQTPAFVGTLPAREAGGLKPSLVQAEIYQPRLPGFGDPEAAAPAGSTDTRAQGPFSTNAEGYPDVGVPPRAEERPTSALGMRGEGNARERFHAAARGILMGCRCPLCEGALAALGETGAAGTAGEDARETRALRGGGMPDQAHESALARALATGLSASVARMERVDESVRGLGGMLQMAVGQIEGTAGDLRRRIETLEAQPLPGGPAAFAFDKTLALAPGGAGGVRNQPGAAEQRRALESLAGKLTDPQAQIAVAAELIRLQRGE